MIVFEFKLCLIPQNQNLVNYIRSNGGKLFDLRSSNYEENYSNYETQKFF